MPNYRSSDGLKNDKIDPDNNQITITDISNNKILNINSQQLSNKRVIKLFHYYSSIPTNLTELYKRMYPNQGYGNQGYGNNQGYGMNQGMGMNQGYGMNQGMGMGGMCMNQGMGMGGCQGQYMFNQQNLEMQARSTFMQNDFNRSGTLSLQELRCAVNQFCMLNGTMPVMDQDFMMLVSIFDVDGSGQIDFFEYKMMLEHLGGFRLYDRNQMMGMRGQRMGRMQQYNSFW